MSPFQLATLNAVFNSSAMLLMTLGFIAIKRKRRETHKRYMLAAFTASCLFLTSYLTRIVLYGDTKFMGEGPLRVFYLVLLGTHVVLAMAVAPMVITTLVFGLRSNFERHKKIARITLPIWAYVSVTGVMVYAMLYLR